MVIYKIMFTKQAAKDVKYLKSANLVDKVKRIIEIIKINPYQNPPPFEKLIGDLDGLYSRRINIQHRLVYQIDNNNNIVKIIRMWKHYE